MFKSKKLPVAISMPKQALESIFDECDQFDVDETGGRVIGHYKKHEAGYEIQVLGVIGPGPQARRSPTSFFQDGEYQEQVFRSIEEAHPDIEHLGNWHTHHVNGLPTLSSGDKSTYFNIVNHAKHNTDFFYALLVVRKNTGRHPRYDVKHYFFRRNDKVIYEIPHTEVQIVEAPIVWPSSREHVSSRTRTSADENSSNLERTKDQEFFSEFYPHLKALFSKSLGVLYWKGKLALVDGSHAEIVAMEYVGDGVPFYSITASGNAPELGAVSAGYQERRFRAARHAVLHLERDINQSLYHGERTRHEHRHS